MTEQELIDKFKRQVEWLKNEITTKCIIYDSREQNKVLEVIDLAFGNTNRSCFDCTNLVRVDYEPFCKEINHDIKSGWAAESHAKHCKSFNYQRGIYFKRKK